MDTEAPAITDKDDVTAIEGEPIDEIVVETDESSDTVVNGLTERLEYEPETGIISEIPDISDWSDGERSKDYTVTIEATDEVGNTSSYVFNTVIERDLSGADDSNFLATGES